MVTELTEKQAAILRFIAQRIHDGRGAPTYREVAAAFGYRSTQAVADHFAALERKGYIHRDQRISRGIILAEHVEAPQRGIPIVGRVAAGVPITAVENLDGYLDFQEMFGPTSAELFALEVHGDSMIDAGIWDGDFCIIRKQSQVENGQLGVAVVDGEATVKRIHREGGMMTLYPANEQYEPMSFDLRTEEVSIAGKVVGIYRMI